MQKFSSTFSNNLGSLLSLFGIIAIVFAAYKYIDTSYVKKNELAEAFKDKNITRKEYAVVPGNVVWIDSQIKVKPGQTVTIKASGSVNLAIHRSVQAAENDVRPSLGWCDPTGIELLPANKPLYKRRKQLLISPKESYGSLVMVPWLEGNSPPSTKLYQPEGIKYVGKQYTFTHDENAEVDATLYFTVNDTYLNPEGKNKDAYVGTQEEISQNYPFSNYTVDTLSAWWDRLYKIEYWNVWFDDNAGAFFVEAEFLN